MLCYNMFYMKSLYKKIFQNFISPRNTETVRKNEQKVRQGKIEEATKYIGDRFGRALIRLSDS